MNRTFDSVMQQVRELAVKHRDTCLWFLRTDYVPQTPEEARRVLEAIERNGDLAAYKEASSLRQWLSQNSSATSAG